MTQYVCKEIENKKSNMLSTNVSFIMEIIFIPLLVQVDENITGVRWSCIIMSQYYKVLRATRYLIGYFGEAVLRVAAMATCAIQRHVVNGAGQGWPNEDSYGSRENDKTSFYSVWPPFTAATRNFSACGRHWYRPTSITIDLLKKRLQS